MSRSFNKILHNILNEANQTVKEDDFLKALKKNDPNELKSIIGYFTDLQKREDYLNRIKRIFSDMKITDKNNANITLSFKKEDKKTIETIKSTLKDSKDPNGTLLNVLIKELMAPNNKPDQEVCSIFEGIKGWNDIKDTILKDLNRKSKGKVDADSLESQWEKMGKIITYKCIEMLDFSANSKTQIDAKNMQKAMKDAFGKLPPGYLQQFVSIDQKMEYDAVTMTLKELVEDGTINETYFNNYIKNMLNEDNNSSDAQKVMEELKQKGYKYYLDKLQDPKSKKDVKKYINAVKTLYKEDFEQNYERLQGKFEKGRQEMLEEEKSDESKVHYDPSTDAADNGGKKRVGRLGNHGPMTFIKNHEDLNKAVEAIDGQDWNIFNCGAKLLIKLFKLIEHGSKKWLEFKENWKLGFEKFKKDVKNKKIKDYINDINNCESAEQAISVAAIALAKYENNLLNGIELNIFVPDQNNQNILIVDQKAKDDFVNRYKLLIESKQILDALQKKLDEIAKNAQQSTNESYINEADDVMDDTQKEVNKEADDLKKKAQKNTKEEPKEEDEESKEEKSDEEIHAEKQNKDWKNMDFKIDISGVGDYFESIDSYVDADNTIKAATEYFRTLSEKDTKYKEPISVLTQVLDMCDIQETGHFLTSEEITLKNINGGKFVQLWTEMLNSLNKVNIESLKNFKEEINIEKEDIKTITGDMAFIDSRAIQYVPDDNNDNTSSSEIIQQAIQLVHDIENGNRENWKKKIEELQKKKEELSKSISSYYSSISSDKNRKEIISKYLGKHVDLLIHPDKLLSEHIIPCIWICTVTNTLKDVNESILLSYNPLNESNEEFEKMIQVSVNGIDKVLPKELEDKVYKSTFESWEKFYNEQFVTPVNKMVEYVKSKVGDQSDKIDMKKLLDEKHDPLLKLLEMLGFFEDANNEENTEVPEEAQQEFKQIGYETNQSTNLAAQLVKKKEFDKTGYEKLVAQFNKEKEQWKSSITKHKLDNIDGVAEKIKDYAVAFNSDFKEDRGSIIYKIFAMKKFIWNVVSDKGRMKESFYVPFIDYSNLLVEDFDENAVKAKIKETYDFFSKYLKEIKDYKSKEAEDLFYKKGSGWREFNKYYDQYYVANIKEIYAQVKQIFKSDDESLDDDLKKIMEGGPGQFDLYLVLLACEQIIAKPDENKEENSEESNENQEQNQEEKTESLEFPIDKTLFDECYKYIRG